MKILKGIFWVGLVLVIGGGVLSLILFFYFSIQLPSVDQILSRQVPQSTKIYDRTGEVLLYEISGGEKRTAIPLDQIPEHVKDATISIEDAGFYTEPGFSIRGILRAFYVNLTSGEIVQGGSSITQQLARNAFLSPEQKYSRKLKELLLAIRLTRHLTKDEILELYLNEISYGPTIYGIEAASQSYFEKSATDLNLAESAILAALPQAPSYYSPWGNHRDELFERQKLVLKRTLDEGKITEEERDAALEEKITFAARNEGIKAPHFVIAVQEYLVNKYGEDLIRVGGLKVVTTLNWNLQQLGEKVVAEGAARNENLYEGKNAALVAEDPKTGQILAMVGSRNYFDAEIEGNFNVASQGLRQPGSALKPFAYMTAFTQGYTPSSVVFDVLTEFDTTGDANRSYKPENFDNHFRGPVSFRQALAQSINIPAVKVLYLTGIENVLDTARTLGITTLNDPRRYGLSLVLGGGEVKLIDMVSAYSVLAQEGIQHPQTMILEIRDSEGKVIEEFKESGQEVINPEYPRLVNDILTDVNARSALYSSSIHLTQVPGHDTALKTGTSNDYRDAWVFGYTPALVTGIWAGNNDNQPMKRQGSSILAALPIWDAFMEEALKEYPPEAFTRPEPVAAQKPILAGNYAAGGEIHSILYYVDRKNPTGPAPADPERDPQFENWESAIHAWVSENSNFLNNLGQPGSDASILENNLLRPNIQIFRPSAGEFFLNQIQIQAQMTANADITKINIYLNGSLTQKFEGSVGTNYVLNWQFTPSNPQAQNLLEIEAITSEGNTSKTGVIIYK